MPIRQEGLTIFVDLDGTQNTGRTVGPVTLPLVSLGTAFGLAWGGFALPPEDQELKEARISWGLKEALNIWFHTNRKLTDSSEEGLWQLADLRDTFRSKNISIEILSGRQPYLHALTRRQLLSRVQNGFFDGVRLNTTDSSTGFKELQSISEVERGRSVVLMEDDVRAALRVARVQDLCTSDQSVAVYLLNNLSNHPLLLRRAGVILPENVRRVSTFNQAAIQIRHQVFSGSL